MCRHKGSQQAANGQLSDAGGGQPQPVMVILVGAPGAGKSSWTASLIWQAHSAAAWQRINQAIL